MLNFTAHMHRHLHMYMYIYCSEASLNVCWCMQLGLINIQYLTVKYLIKAVSLTTHVTALWTDVRSYHICETFWVVYETAICMKKNIVWSTALQKQKFLHSLFHIIQPKYCKQRKIHFCGFHSFWAYRESFPVKF